MSLYYEPNARITVGKVVFNNINGFTITESVKELGDSAVVTLPRNFKEHVGKSILDYIAVGDPVLIEAGTDGNYFEEFSGFLGQIESDAPMLLHIDDAFYPLKRNSFKKAWEKVSLKELLTYVAADYTIDCPDVELGQFQISNVSSYRVLTALVEQFGFYAKIYGKTLKCYWAFDFATDKKFTYKFGNNIKTNNLKYHRAEDVKLKVKGIANQRNGKKFTYETGSTDKDATLRTLNYGNITEKELKLVVEKDFKRFSFDGYSGTITGFAMPRTHAGDTLTIVDDNQADREGNYLIEKTTIKYSLTGGFDRENTLSFKR